MSIHHPQVVASHLVPPQEANVAVRRNVTQMVGAQRRTAAVVAAPLWS